MRFLVNAALECLALGPRYQAEDFQIQSIFPLETFSSGLQSNEQFPLCLATINLVLSVISINDTSKRLDQIQDGQPLRVILFFFLLNELILR